MKKQYLIAKVGAIFYILEKSPNQSYWKQHGLGYKKEVDALRWAATCKIVLQETTATV
jgi:hypothetical protein